jgi:hypothetical protein
MAREAAVRFVMIDGQQAGPMSRAEIGLQLASGGITAETFVWKDGMNGWKPGGEVSELAQLFEPEAPSSKSKPPPPPPAAFKAKAKSLPAVSQKKDGPKQGMMDFDTGHFKVSTEVHEDDGDDSNAMEFDTSHFRVNEGKAKPDAGSASKINEFNTGHFKSNGPPPDENGLSLEMNRPVMKPGVSGYPDQKPKQPPRPYAVPDESAMDSPGKASARPGQGNKVLAPPGVVAVTKRAPRDEQEEDKDWAERTSVEALPFGERVHQEEVASSLFDGPVPEVTGAARALDFSSIGAKGKPVVAAAPKPVAAAAAPKPLRTPTPIPEQKSAVATPSPRPSSSPLPLPAPEPKPGMNKVVLGAVIAAAVAAIAGLIYVLG